MGKIKTFKDLNTWKEAHKLALLIYKLTKSFRKTEVYGLTNQIRRCAVSISSNITEGFSRQSLKEKMQFYYTSKGSLTKLENQLIISKDVRYVSNKEYLNAADQIETAGKLLTGLIRSVARR